jgi:arylsulfatase A-like enzyme
MPTLAEFTGTKSPENEGVSLYQHLTEGSPLDERNIYWHYPHYSYQLGQPSGAIRAGNYKLIEFFEDGSTELYDLENDPGESKNLADSLPEIENDLLEQLHQWQTEAGAEMPTANPDYDPESK